MIIEALSILALVVWLATLSIKLYRVRQEDTEAGLHLCRRINDVEHAGEMRLKQFDIAARETMARIQQVESGQLIARNDTPALAEDLGLSTA